MDRGPQSMTDLEFEKLCLRCGRTLNSGGQVSLLHIEMRYVSQSPLKVLPNRLCLNLKKCAFRCGSFLNM